jgi:hypothetical protein
MSSAERTLGRLRAAHPARLLPAYEELVYALVLVWGLGDVLSTFFAASTTGTAAMESNPWIRVLLANEPLLVLVVKAAVVLYAGVVLLECRSIVEQVPGHRAWFVGVVGIGVVVTANNLAVGVAAVA